MDNWVLLTWMLLFWPIATAVEMMDIKIYQMRGKEEQSEAAMFVMGAGLFIMYFLGIYILY